VGDYRRYRQLGRVAGVAGVLNKQTAIECPVPPEWEQDTQLMRRDIPKTEIGKGRANLA